MNESEKNDVFGELKLEGDTGVREEHMVTGENVACRCRHITRGLWHARLDHDISRLNESRLAESRLNHTRNTGLRRLNENLSSRVWLHLQWRSR